MYIEYYKFLTSESFDDLRTAVNERKDNLIIENFSDKHKSTLEKLISHQNLKLSDYILLKEMAGLAHKFWDPGAELRIFFMGGDRLIIDKVIAYASEWTRYGNIKFSETNNPQLSDLRVSFENNGSWSYLGIDAKGVSKTKATMNFGWLNDKTIEKDFKQVVLHEFGHALGLIHEHQSPDAEIEWNKEYVYRFFLATYKWDKTMVNRNIFEEFEASSTQHSTIDKLSIMGYYIPPEFTINDESFPMNLSEMDKRFIAKIYYWPLNS